MITHENLAASAPKQVANSSLTSTVNKSGGAFQLMNNRPEAIIQRQLQAKVINSSQVRQSQAYQEMANAGLQARQLKTRYPAATPVIQLKRSKDTVLEELSAHMAEGGNEQSEQLANPENLDFPVIFDTKSLAASEKQYDDSYATGEKILTALEKAKTVREEEMHFTRTERLLNTNYEDTLKYTVSVPKQQEVTQEDSHSNKEDDDDLFGGLDDFRERRPQSTMEDEDVNTLQDGQKVKKYLISTGRQANRGETYYNNQYDPQMKTFIAAQNFGDKDKESAGSQPVATNADIIVAQIQALKRAQFERKPQDRETIELKTLKRQGIINAQTLHTILWSDGSKMQYLMKNYSMSSNGEEKPYSKDFIALLGSPNGRAGGWLLVHYAKLLGLDPIKEIRYDEDNMYINYGEPVGLDVGEETGIGEGGDDGDDGSW